MSDLRMLLDALAERPFQRAVMITLTHLEGSGYRKAGARMVVTEDGWSCGAVSGGCIEGILRDHARRSMTAGQPHTMEVDTTSSDDILFGSGLGCPGKLQFLFEPLQPEDLATWRARVEPSISLHVFGAGNDAQPLIALARTLGWPAKVYDSREAFLTAERFPAAELVKTHPAPLALDALAAVVVSTHNYFIDLDWLRHALRTPAQYIALVGSRRRLEMISGVLREEGFDPARLRGPAGLDIGSETPAEIALSILAEAKATFAGRDGHPLSRQPAVAERA